ncbi:MAG: 16S rRNA (cytidine(1402)-2'-O)-methyltransferase [Burkholderiaceae bacterium]|nr:16S rRNA (cytidine(1402)-2'-O)-methyltransferase [Burkholderiaceae bacterium]
MTSTLYVVATPIGHLSDLSPRASETLRAVAAVAAEDTRVTRVLLAHAGSAARLFSAHAHNEADAARRVLALLGEGQDVALVSDAGTPAISDPGAAIVAAAHEAGFAVVPVPGPSAVTALLSAAGLASGPFLFEGFLPAKAGTRDARLAIVADAADRAGAVLVVYEAPHRIDATIAAITARCGAGRRVAIGRELTKRFEEIYRGALGEVPQWLDAKPERRKGEFAIAIDAAPASDAHPPGQHAVDLGQLLAVLLEQMPTSAAVRRARELTGAPHKTLYAMALAARDRAR